jgi:hypothetical protein
MPTLGLQAVAKLKDNQLFKTKNSSERQNFAAVFTLQPFQNHEHFDCCHASEPTLPTSVRTQIVFFKLYHSKIANCYILCYITKISKRASSYFDIIMQPNRPKS